MHEANFGMFIPPPAATPGKTSLHLSPTRRSASSWQFCYRILSALQPRNINPALSKYCDVTFQLLLFTIVTPRKSEGATVMCVEEAHGTQLVWGGLPSRKKCKGASQMNLVSVSSSISLSCQIRFRKVHGGESGAGALLVVRTRNSIGTVRRGCHFFGCIKCFFGNARFREGGAQFWDTKFFVD